MEKKLLFAFVEQVLDIPCIMLKLVLYVLPCELLLKNTPDFQGLKSGSSDNAVFFETILQIFDSKFQNNCFMRYQSKNPMAFKVQSYSSIDRQSLSSSF